MIELGPDEALTYSPEWMKVLIVSHGGQRLHRDGRRSGARAPRRPRRRARGPCPAARGRPRSSAAAGGALGQLVRSSARRTRAGRGRSSASPTSSVSGSSSRSACASTRPIPSPPGESTSTARRRADRDERAAAGRDPLPGPGHRPHGRAASRARSGPAAPLRRRRDRVRREHADGGDLHRRPTAACRRHDPVVACRSSLAGQIVRGLELTLEDGRIVDVDAETGRGRRPRRARDGREARPVSASSRSSPATLASGRPGSRSSTRSSTRTRPATSPTAWVSPTRSRASPARR